MPSIETWVDNQPPTKAKSLTIIRGVDFLHISTDHSLKPMTPWISKRQMGTEDRTIPRICGSETVFGCILGHAGVWDNFVSGDNTTHHPYYTIYRCCVEAYIRPTKKLVPDVVGTRELWIVPYDASTSEVPPVPVGTLLPVRLITEYGIGKVSSKLLFYVKVDSPLTIVDKVVEVGLYSFIADGFLFTEGSMNPNTVEDFKSITPAQWKEAMKQAKEVNKK